MNSQEIFDTEFGHVVFKINKDSLSLRLFQTLEKVQPIWELLKEYEIYLAYECGHEGMTKQLRKPLMITQKNFYKYKIKINKRFTIWYYE